MNNDSVQKGVLNFLRMNLRVVQNLAAFVANYGNKPLKISSAHDLLKAKIMSNFIDDNSKILDIGCGNGRRLLDLMLYLDNIECHGIEVFNSSIPKYPVEYKNKIEISSFDGKNINFGDKFFEFSTICYVLHHLENKHALKLLGEAVRVTKHRILILEDSLEHFSGLYKVRNWCHATEANLQYSMRSDYFVRNFNHNMFKNHKEWVNIFTSFDRVKDVKIIKLDKISKYKHHTLFVIELNEEDKK